jgi:hypothetical protein
MRSLPPCLLLLAALATAVGASPAEADETLRYRFDPGETNVYRVQLEVTVEGGTVHHLGYVVVGAKRLEAETGQATLALRGNLPARTEQATPPVPYRPPVVGRNLGFPRYAEIEVDSTGRVLAEVGDVRLPLQAGDLGASLFWPLPDGEGTSVERVIEVSLPNDQPRPGMPWYPPHFDGPGYGRGGSGSFQAERKTRLEVTATTPQSAELRWTWGLRSQRRFEGSPQFEASGEGQAVLDRAQGLLREIRFNYRETNASENVTRRSRLGFEARLLEGDERLAALNRSAPRTPQTLTVADVRDALEALASKDDERRAEALAKLQSDSFEPLPPDIAVTAEGLLDSRDDSVRWVAARIVAEAATSEQVPTLLRLLRQPESPARAQAIQALGRLKDTRAIEPLVEFVARGESEGYAAIEALKQFDPEAEPAVLGLFAEKGLQTRRAACQILEQLGTARSLDTLREAMLDTDRQLRDLASQAVGAIAGRSH